MCCLLTQYFGLRGHQEHHGLMTWQLTISQSAKTTLDASTLSWRRFGKDKKRQAACRKAEEILRQKCLQPVLQCPFLKSMCLGDQRTYKPKNSVWCKAQTTGTNHINKMMKPMYIAGNLPPPFQNQTTTPFSPPTSRLWSPSEQQCFQNVATRKHASDAYIYCHVTFAAGSTIGTGSSQITVNSPRKAAKVKWSVENESE